MKTNRIAKLALMVAVAAGCGLVIAADKSSEKKDEMPCCPIDPKAAASLDKLKALAGKWTGGELTTEFRPTSNGSAVIETMNPGGKGEMVNLFTASGDAIVMTHYCAMGNQPHMKLASSEGKTLKFEFVDGGNIKTRNDPHMDSVTFTIDGDKLSEDWSFYADGKVTGHTVFEMTRVK